MDTIEPTPSPREGDVVVYSLPNCVKCDATYRALGRKGISYTVVDLAGDPEAHAMVRDLGHTEAPVVVAGTTHWSGFRPDRINELAS